MKAALLSIFLSTGSLASAALQGTLNLQYHTNFHLYTYFFTIGTPAQGLNMRVELKNIQKTFTVEKGGCETCTVYDHNFGYNRTASNSSSNFQNSQTPLNQLGVRFLTYSIQDNLCLQMNSGCVPNFQFNVITKEDELLGYDLPQHREIDGVVNFSPFNTLSYFMKLRETFPGVNIKLNLNQAIGGSISYSDTLEISNKTTVQTKDWSFPLKQVSFGNLNLVNNKINALIETALPSIYLPKAQFNSFKQEVISFVQNSTMPLSLDHIYIPNVASYLQFTGSSCSDIQEFALPNMTFKLERPNDGNTLNQRLHVPAYAYVKDYTVDYYGDNQLSCRIMVQQNFYENSSIILGTVFLEEYGVGLLLESSTMGFDGYIELLPPDSSKVPLWAIIVLSLIVLTAITASFTVCIKQKLRKNGTVVVQHKDVLLKQTIIEEKDKQSCINKDCSEANDE